MSQDEKRKRESRLSSLTSALKRHQEERLEISAFRVGNIRAEKAVVVTAGATLIGDLLAPEIVVEGLVYGYVACQRLIVAPGGQIWGDVYVSALELAPEGKINGWVSTLDAGTVDLLRSRVLALGDLPGREDQPLPNELVERIGNAGADVEDDQRKSQRRSGIWRQLRSEAALALLARAEIEATFEQRKAEALAGVTPVADEADADEAAEDGTPSDQTEAGVTAPGETQAPPGAADEPAAGEHEQQQAEEEMRWAAETERLRAQLQQATSAAQKYYGELLWTRAELRAARGGDDDQ